MSVIGPYGVNINKCCKRIHASYLKSLEQFSSLNSVIEMKILSSVDLQLDFIGLRYDEHAKKLSYRLYSYFWLSAIACILVPEVDLINVLNYIYIYF